MSKIHLPKIYRSIVRTIRTAVRNCVLTFVLSGVTLGSFLLQTPVAQAEIQLTISSQEVRDTRATIETKIVATEAELADNPEFQLRVYRIPNFNFSTNTVSNLVVDYKKDAVSLAASQNTQTKQIPVNNLEPSTDYYVVLVHLIQGGGSSTQSTTLHIKTSADPNTQGFVNGTQVQGTTFQDGSTNTTPSTNESGLPTCNPLTGEIFGCISQFIYYLFFVPTSFLLALSGLLFDFSLGYSIDSDTYSSKESVTFVSQGWKMVRDMMNILFIFILLYAALSTMLSLGGADVKRTIGMIVIVALFINFSLFFTKIIIDMGNVLARVFYSSMSVKDASNSTGGASTVNNLFGTNEKSISVAIVAKFNPQSLLQNSLQKNNVTVQGGVAGAPPGSGIFIIVTLIMSAINVVVMLMFINVSFLFIARVIGLWLAMILSPVAFISLAVPDKWRNTFHMQSFGDWLGGVAKLSLMAPVFLFFLYLIIKFISMDGIFKSLL